MLVILSIFNISTTIFLRTPPSVNKFEVTKFTSLYNHPYTRVQHSNGIMDIDIDYSPCFNWNTTLVFAWISASYKTGPKNLETSVTVYDNIMLRTSKKFEVKFSRKGFEYPLVDYYKSLPNKEVKFILHWEHMPVIGPILKVFNY